MKKILFIFIGLCAIAAIAFFLLRPSSLPSVGTKPLTPVSVRLAWLNQAQFAGMYVAKEKGFYADEGLLVDLKEFDFELDQGKDVANGDSDFGVTSAQELISFIDRGDPLKAIAVIYQISPYAFASLKDQAIVTPADLKGKVLGVAGGNLQAKVTYQALLQRYNIPLADVTFKNLGFDTPQDIATHQADIVDLYRTDQVYLLNKKGVTYNLLLPEQFDFSLYGDVLMTTSQNIEEHPEVVRAFTRATIKGWEYATKHVDETLSIVAQYANEQYQDEGYERYILEQSIPLINPIGKLRIGDMEYLKWKKAIDAMVNAGIIKGNFQIRDVYTSVL